MTVEESGRVDATGRHRATGNIILGISDHLPWDAEGLHFRVLDAKVATYLRYIKSGQIWERFPFEKNPKIEINIVYKFPLTEDAVQFFTLMSEALEREEGVLLTHHHLPSR